MNKLSIDVDVSRLPMSTHSSRILMNSKDDYRIVLFFSPPPNIILNTHLPAETVRAIGGKSNQFLKAHLRHTLRVNAVGADIKTEFPATHIAAFMHDIADIDPKSDELDDLLNTSVGQAVRAGRLPVPLPTWVLTYMQEGKRPSQTQTESD